MTRKTIVSGVLAGLLLSGLLIGGSFIPVSVAPSESVQPVQTVVEEEEEVRGVWVSTVNRLDFPSTVDLSAEELRHQIDGILQNIQDWGMNTVVFQVRPACDALYASEIFPVSSVLSSQGVLPDGFDPLAYAVESAHERGLQLHAWVNPLRVTTGTADAPAHDIDSLPQNSPARQHPEWVVAYADGQMYLDPGIPEVRQLVADGVSEILEKYDVDGIHFDDYFYPYPVSGESFNDAASFTAYGDDLSLEDWRRENITDIIRCVHAITLQHEVTFGVSPFAVWQNQSSDPQGSATTAGVETHSDLYADTRMWVKEGLIDYICPQIYWSFEQEPAPFDVVFNWWVDCVADTAVDLWVGHAFYKQGTDQPGWSDAEQTARQILYAREVDAYAGSLFFRYGNLLADPGGATAVLLKKLAE